MPLVDLFFIPALLTTALGHSLQGDNFWEEMEKICREG